MDKINLPRLAERVFGAPLAIHPPKLAAIINVLEPRLSGLMKFEPQAAIDSGNPDQPAPLFANVNGVAVIDIFGSLVQRSSWLDAMSGLVSYESIRESIDAALADGAVDSILLNIDSPGGEVAGCFDLVDHIYESRSEKPIIAIANELAASAGYAIASAASQVLLTRTATVGSIGVIAAHVNQAGLDQQNGLEYTMIYAGEHKADGHPHGPLTDSARANLQGYIDKYYEIFVDTVARNRGLSKEAVRGTEAMVYVGADALASGLADKVSTLSDALSEISKRGDAANFSAQTTNFKEKHMTTNILKKAEGEELEKTETEVKPAEKPEEKPADNTGNDNDESEKAAAALQLNKAVQAERGRCIEIFGDAVKLGVPLAFAEQLVKAGTDVLKAKNELIDYSAANSSTATIRGINSGANKTTPDVDPNLPVEERCKQEWEKSPELRNEFSSNLNAYIAFKKAEESGQARILKK